jgi:hypothetical protein
MKIIIFCSLLVIIIFGCSANKQSISTKPKETFSVSQNISKSELIDLGNGWFKVTEFVVIKNITPEKATEKAIQRACKRAIEYFSGIEISGRIINIQAENQNQILIDNFSSITQQTAQGIVIEKEILSDEIIFNENRLLIVVTIKVKVDKQKGEKDPSFEINANLNREYFEDGEEIELSVKSSKDCFFTILNICSNDSVYVIFPNEYRKNNFVKSGVTFQLPNSNDKKMGLYFPVNLLPNKNEDFEMIKIIATKQKIDFSSVYSFSAYGTYQTALIDLQKWLLKIPRNEIEEVDLQYFISK